MCCAVTCLKMQHVVCCVMSCAMQEVISADKPRFSISGWYHRDVPQEGASNASLQQLQMKAGADQRQEHTDFEGGWQNARLAGSGGGCRVEGGVGGAVGGGGCT